MHANKRVAGPIRFAMMSSRVEPAKFYGHRSVKAKRHVCRLTMLPCFIFSFFRRSVSCTLHARSACWPRACTHVACPRSAAEQSSSPSSARRACLQLDTILNMCSPARTLAVLHTHAQLNAMTEAMGESFVEAVDQLKRMGRSELRAVVVTGAHAMQQRAKSSHSLTLRALVTAWLPDTSVRS
jgi:hypothetical protein